MALNSLPLSWIQTLQSHKDESWNGLVVFKLYMYVCKCTRMHVCICIYLSNGTSFWVMTSYVEPQHKKTGRGSCTLVEGQVGV